MKKLASLIVSVILLTLSGMRSAQAQGLLNFTPQAAKASAATPQSKPAQRSAPVERSTAIAQEKSAMIDFQVPESRSAKPAQAAVTDPSSFSNNLSDRCENCGSDLPVSQLDDRLVAVAPDELFAGGSDSLVARAVGSAEGTRTPDGSITWAYHGHTDPGNGVWNMGSFSYQHGATSPDDADRRQLVRLRNQYAVIEQNAASAGLRLGLEEQLNGIDLANQAPLAALEEGGYIDRLRQAYALGLRGSEAVLHARTYSYLDPRTDRWDAPGLGNNYYSIKRDQARRQDAIYQAIQLHQQTARSIKRSDDIRVSRND